MLSAKLLTFCAGLAYLCASAYGLHHTHVDNHLSVPIHASTNYVEGHSQFKARNIPAGGSGMSLPSSCYTNWQCVWMPARAMLVHRGT